MENKESFVIEGLAGKKRLKGTVKVNGAKNAALKAMAAAVLFDGPVCLENVPETDDIDTLSKILAKLGTKIGRKGKTLTVDAGALDSTSVDSELAGNMRASVVLTGPLLSRFKEASFPAPGGCVIGTRPIDLFIAGYRKMGAVAALDDEDRLYKIGAPGGLKGAGIFFDKVSVGGTETLMMAAVLAAGRTVLKNCAMEPEIVSLAGWLNACGAKIKGAGTPTIEIEGTASKLLSPKKPYVTIPDRIEAGSFLILGALCAEELAIEDCEPGHLESTIGLLRDSGVPIETGSSVIRIKGNSKPASSFKPVLDLRTHEYPGFPTDLQPVMVTYLTQVSGESKVFETIYDGRFKYVEDLKKLGASIAVMNPREIEIKGPTPLAVLPGDGELKAHDIRAGFAVTLAALAGKGTFTVGNVNLIDRGYERLEERLIPLGAQIKRVVL